jgi:hypothetical protein
MKPALRKELQELSFETLIEYYLEAKTGNPNGLELLFTKKQTAFFLLQYEIEEAIKEYLKETPTLVNF